MDACINQLGDDRMIKTEEIVLLGKTFCLTPLKLRYSSELLEYQGTGKPIPYDFKLSCFLDGVKIKLDTGGYEQMIEEKINITFMQNPLAFSMLLNMLIAITLGDDLKKSVEYLSIASPLLAKYENPTV